MLTFLPGGCNRQSYSRPGINDLLFVSVFVVCIEKRNISDPIWTDDLDVTFNSKETLD